MIGALGVEKARESWREEREEKWVRRLVMRGKSEDGSDSIAGAIAEGI